MESCRNGSDDLSDPQFADLAARLADDPELRGQFQRLQEADRAIGAAFASVPVPAGLADRVSRCLAEAAGGRAEPAQAAAAGSQPAADPSTAPAARPPAVPGLDVTAAERPTLRRQSAARFSRRRLLVGFTALSAAVVLLAAVWIETHSPPSYTPDRVLAEAVDFFGNDNQPLGPLVSEKDPPAEYPMSRDIVQLPNVRWRYVEKFLGRRAVAYDLPSSGGRATLYVLLTSVPDLPPIPPTEPRSTTGGKSAAAWQAGTGLLYVLVVEGDARIYSSYLDQAHGPLT
jgi:hypothetical protein